MYIGSCGTRQSKQYCTALCKCKGLFKWWENNDKNNVKFDNVMNEDDQEEPFHIDNGNVE